MKRAEGLLRGTLLPLSSSAVLSERLQVPVPRWQGRSGIPTGDFAQPGVVPPPLSHKRRAEPAGGNICIVAFPFESKGVKDVIEELRIVTKRFLRFSLSWPNLVIWPPAGTPNNSGSSACIFSHLFTKKEALSLTVHQP